MQAVRNSDIKEKNSLVMTMVTIIVVAVVISSINIT